MSIITLSHGSGGKDTQDLMKSIFYKHFNNDILLQENDSSIVEKVKGRLAITTDSFVINPLFFPGGDIGKLSICGTINDLSVIGEVIDDDGNRVYLKTKMGGTRALNSIEEDLIPRIC
ncbi:hypothetical protein KQH99_01120 [Clostridium cochlearium]|mgnify:FL=1|nr:hypothetical protein [Clostridium cochlearium]